MAPEEKKVGSIDGSKSPNEVDFNNFKTINEAGTILTFIYLK